MGTVANSNTTKAASKAVDRHAKAVVVSLKNAVKSAPVQHAVEEVQAAVEEVQAYCKNLDLGTYFSLPTGGTMETQE